MDWSSDHITPQPEPGEVLLSGITIVSYLDDHGHRAFDFEVHNEVADVDLAGLLATTQHSLMTQALDRRRDLHDEAGEDGPH